jgi:GT2 family glycosyltransferase
MNGLGIVIVNYRTPDLVIDCLRSLADEVQGETNWRVVVVENDSGDDSAARIQKAIQAEQWNAWAEVLPLDRNAGFAGGNNAALRVLLALPQPPDYLLLLNPDTVVRPGAVRTLLDFMERHPRVGIAGSRLEYPDGTSQRSAFRFPSVASEFEGGVRLGFVSRLLRNRVVAPPVRDEPHPTDWMAGASMMVRRTVFEAVGLMDEAYFLYFEEVDFFLQVRRAGWPSWYVPASHVVHLVGQASGVTDTRKPAKRVPRYWFESRRRYFCKNYGPVYALLANVAWAFGFGIWRLRRWLQRKPDHDPPGLWWDFVRFNFLTCHPFQGGPS